MVLWFLQILLMSDAIGNRTATLTEVENALIQIADKWRQVNNCIYKIEMNYA